MISAYTALAGRLIPVLLGGTLLASPCAHGQQAGTHNKPLVILRAEAEKDDAQAQVKLGDYYRTGEGVTKHAIQAAAWYSSIVSAHRKR